MKGWKLIVAAAGLSSVLAAPLAAHDLWIVPESFHPKSGSSVGLELRVGETFPVSMNGPKVENLDRLALVAAETETAIKNARATGKATSARFVAPAQGTAAIVLEGARVTSSSKRRRSRTTCFTRAFPTSMTNACGVAKTRKTDAKPTLDTRRLFCEVGRDQVSPLARRDSGWS